MPAARGPIVVDVLAARTGDLVSASRGAPESVSVVAESELTAEQKKIRDLENQLAVERGRKDPKRELEEVTNPGSSDNILIHFLEDGITALEQVWYRGQELEIEPNSSAYADTCDRFGNSWLDLRNREFVQIERWGKVMFRTGPWPGKSYEEAALESTGDGFTREELVQAAEAERRRGRRASIIVGGQ